MKKDDINQRMRAYVRSNLSPTEDERNMVEGLFTAVRNVLGSSCKKIGSYPRQTAVTPMHDIDILFITDQILAPGIPPSGILSELAQTLRNAFENPTKYSYEVNEQTHSATISFKENEEEVFAIDIVPAYLSGHRNEFDEDIFYVPELININHKKRSDYYQKHFLSNEPIQWILSDPLGYIKVADAENKKNSDLRKAVKFVKNWKNKCKANDDNFKLKSFHIEQVITGYFIQSQDITIFDAVFKFFCHLPELIATADIEDRAEPGRFIDEYVNEMAQSEKDLIIKGRDSFMIQFENIEEDTTIGSMMNGRFYTRKDEAEEYLFDRGIPTLTDPSLQIVVDGFTRVKSGKRNHVEYYLSNNQDKVPPEHTIDFRLTRKIEGLPEDNYLWKVKNDDSCKQPRGEITIGKTRNAPEATKYKGRHYVEVYAIEDGVCTTRHKRNVIID